MNQLSLFDVQDEYSPVPFTAPLADRMRPESLEDYVGQNHLLGEGKILRQMLENDRISSMIFWGASRRGQDHFGQDHRQPHQVRICKLQRSHQRYQGNQGYHEAGGGKPGLRHAHPLLCG